MKITNLHLKDFKIFNDLELDFTDKDRQPLNQIVLAGLNGTGKTTILEVVTGIFNGEYNIIHIKDNKRTVEPIAKNLKAKLIHNGRKIEWPTIPDKLGSILKDEKINTFYRPAKIRNSRIRKRRINQYKNDYYLEYGVVIEFSYENELSVKKYYLGKEDKMSPISTPDLVHYNKSSLKEIILKPITKKVFENKEIPPKKVIDNEIADMNSIFKGIDLNSRFIDIDDDNLFFESANGQRITFEELSSGEKQLYFIGFMLKRMNINNTIIMIDEPEDSLHPKWQSQLLQFYSNIGENNQVILATHSPHIIGSAKAESVFLLKNENGNITASHPKYSEGHSIPYVLSEIMDVDYRNTYANNLVDKFLTLIRKGEHKNKQGKELLKKIEALNLAPNSEEQQRIDLSLRRFEAIGR